MTPSFVFLLDDTTVLFFNLLANDSLFFMFLKFIQINFTFSDMYISCLFNSFCNRFNLTDMPRLSNVVKQNIRVPQNKQFLKKISYIFKSKDGNNAWLIWFMVFNTTFNNSSIIDGGNHRPVVSH